MRKCISRSGSDDRLFVILSFDVNCRTCGRSCWMIGRLLSVVGVMTGVSVLIERSLSSNKWKDKNFR